MCNLPIMFYAYPAAFLMLLAISITLNACMLWVRLRERKAGAVSADSKEIAMSDLRKIMDKSIEESIRLSCRPGGAIWQAIRRG